MLDAGTPIAAGFSLGWPGTAYAVSGIFLLGAAAGFWSVIDGLRTGKMRLRSLEAERGSILFWVYGAIMFASAVVIGGLAIYFLFAALS
jgi:hypothetical protein